MMTGRTVYRLACGLVVLAAVVTAAAGGDAEVAELPEIKVTAQKEPAAAQSLPVSVTAVTEETIEDADVRLVRDAAVFAPNVVMGDFGPRRLSNPYVRGVGAGPTNPGVTTSFDGVPQLNASSSSIELLDVEQVEFVLGAQGALFGRNSLGGLVNITSRAPSPSLTFDADTLFGNHGSWAKRFRLSGPFSDKDDGFSLAGGYSTRQGYTKNLVTGNDIDDREGIFGKGQLAGKLGDRFDARLIVSGERDSDGGYALYDLAALRAAPHLAAQDFEGRAWRTVLAPTLLLSYRGDRFEATSVTGSVWWRTKELNDLDFSPLPLMTSRDEEKQHQFTQEFRFSSRTAGEDEAFAPGWQGGVFFFRQHYARDRLVDLLPAFTFLPFTVTDGATADVVTSGLGVYGQGRFPLGPSVDLTAGARLDFERAEADLGMAPPFGPPMQQHEERDYSEVSPQVALRWRVAPWAMTYASAGRGYKAGGFNAGAPVGNEGYGEENSWNYELGAKTSWRDGRVEVNAALFAIRWSDLQLYVPNPLTPGNYYVDNVGGAGSRGLELSFRCHPASGWDLFGSMGWADAEFLAGSQSQGTDISGRSLPLTPEFTGRFGVQYGRPVSKSLSWYARADLTVCGQYDYDASNAQGQSTYTLADFRAGLRGAAWFAEGWVRNAFDTDYVPIALPYPGFAPSGYVGESGAPLTFGARAGFRF